jgi:hypothetical protein
MNENHIFAGLTVVSLITMGIGFYSTLRRRKEEPCEDFQGQEEEISK